MLNKNQDASYSETEWIFEDSELNTSFRAVQYRLSRDAFQLLTCGIGLLKSQNRMEVPETNHQIQLETKFYRTLMMIPLTGVEYEEYLIKCFDEIDAERFWFYNKETETEDKFTWMSMIHVNSEYMEWQLSENAFQYICKHPFPKYNHFQLGFFTGEYTSRIFDLVCSYQQDGCLKIQYDELKRLFKMKNNKDLNDENIMQEIILPSLKEIEKEGEEFYIMNDPSETSDMLTFRMVMRSDEEKKQIYNRHYKS